MAEHSVTERRRRSQPGPGPIVRSICLTMVKNEQDIIEPFLRHNRRFFDAIIVIDNNSADRTRDIVAACARELGGIIFADEPRFDHAQSKVISAALRHAQSAFFADFICLMDADEFIGAPDRESFERMMARVPVGHQSIHPWRTFLHDPAVSENVVPDPLHRMTFRRQAERPQITKAFLRMGGGLDPDIVVAQGNHAIRSGRGQSLPAIGLKDLPLLHFPVRSARQLASRGVIGWMANAARGPHAVLNGSAYQWKRIHALACQHGTALGPEVLANEGMVYAQRHTPRQFLDNALPAEHGITTERRHSTGEAGDTLRLVAAAWAASALPAGETAPLADLPASAGPTAPAAEDRTRQPRPTFLDTAPFRYLAEKYRPQNALDLGCGDGSCLRLLQDAGVGEIFGIDALAPTATLLPPESYAKADLGAPQDLGRCFDMVLCLEVAGQIPPDSTETLIGSITRHARDLIVFSMPAPGQPGNNQINRRTMADVLDLWAGRGWAPDLIDTLGIRALSSLSWLRRNLLVLKPAEAIHDPASAHDALCRIAALDYRWYSQPPGPRLAAFREPYPDPDRAYGVVLPAPAPLAPTTAPA